MNAVKTKRGTIKQLLDNKKVYRLSDYARRASNRIGRYVTTGEVQSSLKRMEKEGQLEFSIVNTSHVVGFTFKAIA